MYISQQHWQQPQQQQPLDACFRTVTAYPSNSNESSDSSGNSSDSCSNSLSRTSSNNTSFSSDDDDNYTQQRQEEEDKENLWVVDGIRFTCIDSNSRVRSAVESSTATSRGNGRRSPLSFPPYSSLTPFASTPTASALSPSPPPSPTTPTRPPFIRIESQELLPTRRPGLWFRRSSSSNSLSSLASRRGNTSRRDQQQHQQKQHQQGQQQQQHQQRQNVVPAKPLKSILKKGRPVTPTLTGLHLTHAHLGPVLQHQYQLQLLNQQQQQQQQASSHSQDQLSLRRASSALHQLKRASSIITTSPPVVPPSRPRPLSSPSILNSLSTTSHPPSFPRSLPLPPRPLPTPPATKTVRWASHNEVLIIENIEDLVEMGYFDDYDTEMGWDYRDESLDDDFSVTMDSEEEDDLGSDFDPMGENDERDEELESPSEDGRFEYMYRRSADERDTYFDDDKGKGEGEEEVESSVAEDELIHRMASDQFLGGGNGAMWSSNHHVASDQFLGGGNGAMWSSNHHVASDQVLGGGNGAMRSSNHRVASDQVLGGDNGAKWPSLLYPPLSLSSKTGRSMCASPPPLPMAPPSSPLSSCFWSPPSQEQYEGVSGIIQRFQSLENQNQNNGFTRGSTSGGRSSGMISPPASPSSPQPPPRQSSLTGQSIVINKNDSGRGLSPTSSMSYLPSPSSSASTSPKLEPAVPLLMAPSALRAKCRPPRLDRAQILVEVAERKRNGVGAFASSTASASRYGVDRPLSMVASASNLLRCTRGSNQPVTVVHH